jgi:hypothetical protein
MEWLKADCETPSRLAARVKLRSSATLRTPKAPLTHFAPFMNDIHNALYPKSEFLHDLRHLSVCVCKSI